jgi:manganese-dependent inorganic pyrophosphatase
MKQVLVTGSVYPDTDAVSCMLAYASYQQTRDSSKTYVAAAGGGLHVEPRFVCEQLGLEVRILGDNDKFDEFILVDASEPKGLPQIVRPDGVIEVIDHRLFADYRAFPNARFRIEPVGAAATQVAELFYFDMPTRLQPEHAALLLCGIHSNTVNFQADTTTFRDQRMRNWLQEKLLPEHKDLPRSMYDYKSAYVLENLEEVLRDDAKDDCDFGLDEPVVVFQIETAKAEELLSREQDMLEAMGTLFPDNKHKVLVIQDAGRGQTLIISDSDSANIVLTRTRLPIKSTGLPRRLVIPHIVMRKSIQQAVIAAR